MKKENNNKNLKQSSELAKNMDEKDMPPIEFFATIHHNHYSYGEIDNINNELINRSIKDREDYKRLRHQELNKLQENTINSDEQSKLSHK